MTVLRFYSWKVLNALGSSTLVLCEFIAAVLGILWDFARYLLMGLFLLWLLAIGGWIFFGLVLVAIVIYKRPRK